MLDIAPQIEKAIITQAQSKGVTVNDLLAEIFAPKQKTIADFVKAMPNRSYLGDGLVIQKEIHNDDTPAINPMIALVKSLPKPTSFTNKNAVELQREWRSEWKRTGD